MATWSSGHDTQKGGASFAWPLDPPVTTPTLALIICTIFHNVLTDQYLFRYDRIKFMRRCLHELGNRPEQWLLCYIAHFTVVYFSLSNANVYRNSILLIIRQNVYPWSPLLFRQANRRPSWREGHYCHVTGGNSFVCVCVCVCVCRTKNKDKYTGWHFRTLCRRMSAAAAAQTLNEKRTGRGNTSLYFPRAEAVTIWPSADKWPARLHGLSIYPSSVICVSCRQGNCVMSQDRLAQQTVWNCSHWDATGRTECLNTDCYCYYYYYYY
jgi:hypothetical protein